MASFLTDLVKPYVEKLVNGAIAESSYICCFTCIAKDFEEEKARLEKERATFERRIEEATRRGEDVLPDALALKDEVDQLIEEDTKKEQKCFFEFCPHCLWRRSRGKLLAKKKERIKLLMETGKELTIGVPAHLPDIERCTTQHYVHLKSRESQYAELLVELKDDSNYMIGLHGMGGTGKTTLIKKVGKELKQSKQFTQVIDTTLSFSPNIKKIQDDIAGPLGLKFDECNDSDRPKKLWHRLTNGEKILLILDDVWGDVDFNEIGIPCSDNHKDCRIIVTTRYQSVCHKLGCNKTIQLDLLSKEDAWIMFQKYAGLSETSTKFCLEKGRKIASECKNLPIAITVIAGSLKGKEHQEEWDLALKFLKKDILRHDNDDDFLAIYECFKFSYDKLNEEAKRLFLLCSVFREDEDIPTESLARLAIGGGLFGEDYVIYEEARSRVVKSKRKLLDSCLLMEAGQRSVKMHDFARDAAQWIANNKIQITKMYDKNQKSKLEREKNIKYLLCEGNPKEVFSCKFDGSKLEILIVFIHTAHDFLDKEIEVPDSFFEKNTSLRVFHLRGYGFRGNISLPQSMQQLKNIRSLIFTRCKLGDISIFGNLQSLEELDLDCCEINEMPNGITELEKFRLLNLRFCSIGGNNPFEVIKRCSSLQELYFIFNSYFFEGEIIFPNKLQRFHVSDKEIDSSVSKYVSIELMDNVFLSNTTLKYCLQKAEVLRLGRIEGEWRNITPDIVLMDQGMNDLVELCLHNISQLKCLIDTTKHTYSQVSNVFSKLVVLHMKDMENLEELCNGSLSNDSFKSLESLSLENCKHLRSLSGIANQCNLKSVSLKSCPMLISLFEVSNFHSLALLEILEVMDCENLEDLITHERKGERSGREIFDSRSSNPMFMKLKDLLIDDCPKLEIILPLISAHDLPALESISVTGCDKLKYIFGQGVELGSLKDIELEDVPDLIDIFRECNGTRSFSINQSSPISISASKPTTHPKPIKCSILSWTDMYCCGKKYENKLIYENQPQPNLMESNSNCLSINIWERAQCLSRQSKILCNVKKIELINLRKIISVFVLSIAPKMLLEVLIIRECDKLKHIIIDTGDHDSMGGNNFGVVFPKLKKLIVDDCAELEYIFGHYTNDHRNHTENDLLLSSLEDLSLYDLPSLVSICPKQYHITMPLLKKFVRRDCLYANIKSIGDFIPHHSISISGNCTTMKDTEISVEEDITSTNAKKITSSTRLESGSTSEKIAAATLSTISGTKNESPIQKEPMNEPTMDQQSLLEEIDSTVTLSQLEGSTSEKAVGINNVSPLQLVAPKQKGLINEQSTTQQQSLGESHATIKPSQGNNDIKISVEGGTASTNVKTLAASTSKPEKPSHAIEISVKQGTTSTNSKESTSSSPIVISGYYSSPKEYVNGQTAQQSFSIFTKEPLAMEVVDLESSLEKNQIKNLGDTSLVVEGLGSSLLVRKELERLVSEKHLNYETLSLLTDFFVKHPSVLLKDTLMTNRLKGYAYTCLADLLKFLQTHSVLDVLGSNHSEFVDLVQDVRTFSFNKDWLDGVEKRALFPNLQFSQDAVHKLLDSKKQVTKEIEEMRLKIYFFNQQVENIKHQLTSSEAVLESIIQQEEQILETTAALSVPLGY